MIKHPSFTDLEKHAQALKNHSIAHFFETDPKRFEHFSCEHDGLLYDYSKNLITEETLNVLFKFAESIQLREKIQALFNGQWRNESENRAVFHTALRKPTNQKSLLNGENIENHIHNAHQKMSAIVDQLHQQEWKGFTNETMTDVVNIGIGGSDRGPALVTTALKPYAIHSIKCHFVSNADPRQLSETLASLNPKTTLFIISSKTFTTEETLLNAKQARQWLLAAGATETAISEKHFIGITAATEKAIHYGIPEKHILPFWDWVGGRYSVWSAIGLPIAIQCGMDTFQDFLSGAHSIDQHFLTAEFNKNIPVIMALLSVFYRNGLELKSQAICPYAYGLADLPGYLQQLEMESNGKSVDKDNKPVHISTAPVIWGMMGTDAQHTFFQLLHQGTDVIPVDFILVARPAHPDQSAAHAVLYSHGLAQSHALMCGQQDKSLPPYRAMAGNKPSSTLVLPKLSAYNLGMLLALYEHKIFVQSVCWNINAFDQWGVELGKQIAKEIQDKIANPTSTAGNLDSSTHGLIEFYQTTKPPCP